MFVLRKQHLEAFAQVAQESFEDRMAAQLQIRYRQQCQVLGDAGVRLRIAEATRRAARYDLTSENDVAAFIRYTFGIRPDFDTARQTAWAGAILKDKTLEPHERIEKIKEAAKEHRLREQAEAKTR